MVCWKIYRNKKQRSLEQEEVEHPPQPQNINRTGIYRVSRGSEYPKVCPIERLRENHWIDNRAVAFQALAYVLTQSLTQISLIKKMIVMLHVDTTHLSSDFSSILVKLLLFFQPFQGFFNLLIFISFKIYYQKKLNQSMSYSRIIYSIFCKSVSDPIFIARMTILEDESVVEGIQLQDVAGSVEGASLEHMNQADVDSIECPDDVSIANGERAFNMRFADSSNIDNNISSQSDLHCSSRGFSLGTGESMLECKSDASTVQQ